MLKEQRNVSFGAKRTINEFGSANFAPATTLLAAGTSILSPRENVELPTGASMLRSPIHGTGEAITRMTS